MQATVSGLEMSSKTHIAPLSIFKVITDDYSPQLLKGALNNLCNSRLDCCTVGKGNLGKHLS